MGRRRGVARTSTVRRRMRRARVKWDPKAIVRRFKIMLPDMVNSWRYWMRNLDALEIRTFTMLEAHNVDSSLWPYYVAFVKRLENRALNFLDSTYEDEKTSLITEFILRRLDETVLNDLTYVVEFLVYQKTGRVFAGLSMFFGHVVDGRSVLTGHQLSGLTFGRDHLFYCDEATGLIYEIDKDTHELINSYDPAGGNPGGLCYENASSLWMVDRLNHTCYELNPDTGATISSFNVGVDLESVCLVGDLLYIGLEDSPEIRIYTQAGALQATRDVPLMGYARGLCYVDPYLYSYVVYNEGCLTEFDTDFNVNRIHALKEGLWEFGGLCWDGTMFRWGIPGAFDHTSTIFRVVKG